MYVLFNGTLALFYLTTNLSQKLLVLEVAKRKNKVNKSWSRSAQNIVCVRKIANCPI